MSVILFDVMIYDLHLDFWIQGGLDTLQTRTWVLAEAFPGYRPIFFIRDRYFLHYAENSTSSFLLIAHKQPARVAARVSIIMSRLSFGVYLSKDAYNCARR